MRQNSQIDQDGATDDDDENNPLIFDHQIAEQRMLENSAPDQGQCPQKRIFAVLLSVICTILAIFALHHGPIPIPMDQSQSQWTNPNPNGPISKEQNQSVRALETENAELKATIEALSLKMKSMTQSSTPRSLESDFLDFVNVTAPQLFPSPQLLSGNDIPHDLLRRSRSNVGDRYRFAKLIDKLKSGQCINAAVLGGSISVGGRLSGSDQIWWQHLEQWLNTAFPCNGTHKFVNKARYGTTTDYALDRFYDFFQADETPYDWILAEWGTNDVSQLLKHNNKLEAANSEVEALVMSETELMILGLMQLPTEPMVMYVEMSWSASDKPPFWYSAAHFHSKMLFYYQIPVVSTIKAMFPVHLYQHKTRGVCRHFIADYIHPNHDGHKLTALLIAYSLYEEQLQNIVDPLHSVTPRSLPPVWLANPNDTRLTRKPLTSLLFMNSDFEMSSMNANDAGDWSHSAETTKQKWGLIAKPANASLSIEIEITTSISIGFLKTYENIGTAAMWIDDGESVADGVDCGNLRKKFVAESPKFSDFESIAADGSEYVIFDGVWGKSQGSQFHSRLVQIPALKVTASSTPKKWVHFCLPQDRKFKLLSLTTY